MYHSWARDVGKRETQKLIHGVRITTALLGAASSRYGDLNAKSFCSSCSTISCLGHSPPHRAIHFSANFLQFSDCLLMKRLFVQRFPHYIWISWKCAGDRRFPLIADPNNWRNIRIPNQIASYNKPERSRFT